MNGTDEMDGTGEMYNRYELTSDGWYRIVDWVKSQLRACNSQHPDPCSDETHQVALLLAFAIAPMMESAGRLILSDDMGNFNGHGQAN